MPDENEKDDSSLLRRAFLDISRGYSQFTLENKPYFVKHLSFEDNLAIDEFRGATEAYCLKKKIPSEQDKLVFLAKRRMWTSSDESSLKDARTYLTGLEKNRSNAFLPSQLEQHDKIIKETRDKLNELVHKRFVALDITRERFTDDRLNRFLIYTSLYQEAKCINKIFSSFDEFEELDEEILFTLIFWTNHVSAATGLASIRKIVVSDFFSPYFIIYSDNINNIFKSTVESGPLALSYNQIHFIIQYRHFKKIFYEHQIPDHVRNNPDKIDEYITVSANMKKIIEKSGNAEGGYTAIPGTAKDMKYLKDMGGGASAQNDKLLKEMRSKPIANITEAAKIAGI